MYLTHLATLGLRTASLASLAESRRSNQFRPRTQSSNEPSALPFQCNWTKCLRSELDRSCPPRRRAYGKPRTRDESPSSDLALAILVSFVSTTLPGARDSNRQRNACILSAVVARTGSGPAESQILSVRWRSDENANLEQATRNSCRVPCILVGVFDLPLLHLLIDDVGNEARLTKRTKLLKPVALRDSSSEHGSKIGERA